MRKTNLPLYLANYVTKSESEDLVNHVDFCYALNVPNSFEEAMERDDNLKWKYAMEEEIKSLEKNNMYCVIKLPEGKKFVQGRWVYTIKGDPENPIFKTSYIAKGYNQIYGIDYFENYFCTDSKDGVG